MRWKRGWCGSSCVLNARSVAGACGGELACSTCHLIFEQDVFEQLPEISEEEEDMLDLAWGLTETCVALPHGCGSRVGRLMG